MKEVGKEKIVKDLQKEVAKLEKSINKLNDDIAKLVISKENTINWNGNNAIKISKSLLGHLEHDKVLLENIKKCLEYLNS